MIWNKNDKKRIKKAKTINKNLAKIKNNNKKVPTEGKIDKKKK